MMKVMPSPLMERNRVRVTKLLTFSPPSIPSHKGRGGKKDMDVIDLRKSEYSASEFPLEERPFLMCRRCGISEDETIARIQKMKEKGIIRRIGAVVGTDETR